MQNKFNRIGATVTGAAMLLSSVLSAMPASAAAFTNAKDTMSREKVNETGVTHVVLVTLPGAQTGVIDFTYDAAFSGFTFVSATCGGGSAVDNGTAGNVASVTATACTTPLTLTFTGDNPASAGSYVTTVSGAAGLTGSYAEPITLDDQIGVTATVNPYITFQVTAANTVCDHGTSGNGADHTPATDGGTVAFGVVTPAAISSSVDAAGINHICTFVSTNAASGYALTVQSLNGGLTNGAQFINSEATEIAGTSTGTQTLVPGTEGYVMCLSTTTVPEMDITVPAGSNLTGTSPFAPGTCDDTSATGGKLATSTQQIGSGGLVQEGTAQWNLKTAIAATTGAGSYTDTLTFIATGTF